MYDLKKISNYYKENEVADKVVRCFYRVVDRKNLSLFDEFSSFDFIDFLDELKKSSIDWLGKDFNEVIFEVSNRYYLKEAFKRYLYNLTDTI